MKIIFFGTSNAALPILEELHKHHTILAVVTMPDAEAGRSQELQESPVSALAKDLNLQTFKPDSVKNSQEFFGRLRNLGADIFVVVSYGKILPVEIINLPKFKTVNIHFSVLPKYRGPSPIQSALLNGDEQAGISIFILDEKIDHGPLLVQEVTAVEPYDNNFTLSDKLARLSAKLVVLALEDYTSGKITPLPQEEAQASYTNIITKSDGKIDWNKSSSQIYNQFRAFYPWPGIWTTWNGKILKILDCTPASSSANPPGTVSEGGLVACAEGALQIKILQLEGKNETDINSFLNGYRDFVGSNLV